MAVWGATDGNNKNNLISRNCSDFYVYSHWKLSSWCQSPHFVKSHSLKTFSTFQTRNKISQRTERFSTNKRGNKFFISRKETSLKIKVYKRVVLPVSCCYKHSSAVYTTVFFLKFIEQTCKSPLKPPYQSQYKLSLKQQYKVDNFRLWHSDSIDEVSIILWDERAEDPRKAEKELRESRARMMLIEWRFLKYHWWTHGQTDTHTYRVTSWAPIRAENLK